MKMNMKPYGWVGQLVVAATLLVALAFFAGPASAQQIIGINSGGPAVGPFLADAGFSGGKTIDHANAINTSKVTNPAPAAVYQSARIAAGAPFTYTIPGFTAGTKYLVRLHFCETFWTTAGSRVFNVSINGTQVLTNFDIVAASGGQNIANVQQFTEAANASGQFVITFTSVKDNALISGIEIDQITTSSTCPGVCIDSGSTAAVSPFVADVDFSGGTTINHANTINTSKVTNPAPAAVYQSARIAAGPPFTYTIPGFIPGADYLVRLHFCETFFTTTGSRVFNVSINGTQVLTNFDIVAASGGQNIANVQQFTEAANASGQFVITFTSVTNNALISGIEIDQGTASCSLPTAPSALSANAASSSQINLSWTASSSSCAVTYNVFRSTTSGFTPSSSNQIASGLTSTSFSNTGLAASTTYFYVVEGTNSGGTSAASSQASATTQGSGACSTPTAPSALSANAASSSQINLSWTASSSSCAVTYNVFRSTTSGFTPSSSNQIASGVTSTSFSDTGLAASTTYFYVVQGTNSGGTSAASSQASATTQGSGGGGGVAPPTSLTAVGSSDQQIDLRWVASTTSAPNTAPVNYLIYRDTIQNFTPSSSNQIGTTIGITNFLDSNYRATLLPGTTYFYQVVASTPSGTSTAASASATSLPATPSSAAPAELTGLTAMAQNANEIDLMWNSTNSGVGTVVTTYNIYRSTSPTFTPSTGNRIGSTKSNWFQDVLGAASTRYYYQVLATSSLGTSPASVTVTAMTPALNPQLWGGAPFFDASGLPAKNNVVMLKFLNRTNGKFADNQITWTATIGGVKTTNTIAQANHFDMPANSSGRMYFFLNDPSLALNNTNYWDFIEFTVGPNSINADTTRVDALGVKIAFNLTCSDGTNIALGENMQTFQEDRSVTFQRYANDTPSTPGGNFHEDLQFQPFRIVEPGASGFNSGGDNQNYYATYISDIWSFNGLTIPEAGPNGSGLGSFPDLSAAIFRHSAPTSGTREFASSGSLTNQGMWGNPASFYQTEPYNHYAQWIEAQAINMQQYAFPYNDAGGYSSDIGCSGPQTMVVAIGW